MGNAKARARASQRVTSGKQSQRMQAMSPGTKEKIHTSYRQPQVAADGKKLSFSDAYADKDTEWKATQRARAALPRSQAKRANGVPMNDWVEWSDGCAEQFRCYNITCIVFF
jgi:hypothetical protein